MKTGYEQHFKKIKQTTVKAPAFNVNGERSAPRRKEKKKSSFPLMPLFSFVLIAGLGLLFLENFDSFETYFKKVDIGMGSAQAEEAKVAPTAPATAGAVNSTDGKSLAVEPKKADDADYLFKLAERKKQLDQREEELNKMAAQIEKQKVEITEKLAKLEDVRNKISSALEEKIKVDDGKVETLVQMYSNMKPQQTAKIFETLDEDLVIEILGRMKKKSAADILNLIKPEKAQVFAERYTGYRTPASK
jgi:flagellar motility protein MotE (MotC chaperone)